MMKIDEVTKIADAYIASIPLQVAEQFKEVDVLVHETAVEATAELKKLMSDEFTKEESCDIAADAKGAFIGYQLETEASPDDEDTEEVAEEAEGFVVLVASNLNNAEEVELVLMHELGHALGLDEDEVKELGLSISTSQKAEEKGEEKKPDVPELQPNGP